MIVPMLRELFAQPIPRIEVTLVDDGSTLQVGYGHVPYALLKYFDNKNDLGIHTHMISDAFIPLIKQGIITNKHKNFMGTRRS